MIEKEISEGYFTAICQLSKYNKGICYLKSIINTTSDSKDLNAFEVARLDGMKVALSIITGEKHND